MSLWTANRSLPGLGGPEPARHRAAAPLPPVRARRLALFKRFDWPAALTGGLVCWPVCAQRFPPAYGILNIGRSKRIRFVLAEAAMICSAQLGWRNTLLAGSLSLLLLLGPAAGRAAQQPAPKRNVVTKADLIRLSAEGISDELIITLIGTADELPLLTPDDILALKDAGVSMNVMTAVLQQRTRTVGRRPETTGQPKRRRIRVTASLHPQKRAVWRRMQEKDRIDQVQVSWVFRAKGWRDHGNVDLQASPTCPQDPVCAKHSEGKCLEETAPGSEEWKQNYGCHRAGQLAKFGEEFEVFQVELPEPVADAEIHPYFRSAQDEELHWFSRHTEESSGKRVPAFATLRLWGAEDFDLEVHLQLVMSPGGYVQDFKISECNIVNRDEEALQRRLMSGERQYCGIQEAPN